MQAQVVCQIRSAVQVSARSSFKPCIAISSKFSQTKSTARAIPGTYSTSFLNQRVLSGKGFVRALPGSVRLFSMDSASRTKTKVVEHIVLLKVKPGVPEEKAEAMISALKGLNSLPSVIHLTAGKNTHAQGPDDYTHALHSRYYTKQDLESYASDPQHLEVIEKYIAPIVDDRIAVDWEVELEQPSLEALGVGAVRMVAMKAKSPAETAQLIDLFKGFEDKFPSIKQVSVGLNFSPRSKGFEIGYLGLLPNAEEIIKLSKNADYVDVHKTTILPALENFTMVDYSFS